MSDNSFGTTFGPSAPGAINLVSGNTGGVDTAHEANSPSVATSTAPDADVTPDGSGGFSLTSDAQPYWDDCSTRDAVALQGTNIGDELNAAGLSWGWFQGGFLPTTSFAVAAAATGHAGQPTATFIPDEFAGFPGKVVPTGAHNQALCDAVHPVGVALGETATSHQYGFKDDYIAHHEPFQYYAPTANPHHLAPASLASDRDRHAAHVGGVPQFDTANHNYDTSDFDQLVAAITAGQLPRVRAAGGHLSEGARVRGRPRGVFRARRRAAVPRPRDQRAREDARLVEHRGRHQLRRLRRLVRPCVQRRRERVALARRQPHEHGEGCNRRRQPDITTVRLQTSDGNAARR